MKKLVLVYMLYLSLNMQTAQAMKKRTEDDLRASSNISVLLLAIEKSERENAINRPRLETPAIDTNLPTTRPIKNYPCPYEGCQKICKTSLGLKHHKCIFHKEAWPYPCPYTGCTKGGIARSNLDTHVRTHTGEKPFQCENCLKRFISTTHLKRHFEEKHSGEKKHHCPLLLCAEKFSRHENLIAHVTQHMEEYQRHIDLIKNSFNLKS